MQIIFAIPNDSNSVIDQARGDFQTEKTDKRLRLKLRPKSVNTSLCINVIFLVDTRYSGSRND